MPCIPGGRFSAVLRAMDDGLVLFVPAAGAGFRIGPRQPWQDIRIPETPEGPEILFDAGMSGWPVPCTEADLAKLERRRPRPPGCWRGRADDPQAR